MKIRCYAPLLLAAAGAFAASRALGSVPERAEIPEKDRWNLEAIYPSLEAWEESFDSISPRVDALAGYAGQLGEKDGATLLAFLKEDEAVSLELGKLYVYANMKSHEDMRVTRPMELAGKVENLMVRYGAATAFFNRSAVCFLALSIAGYYVFLFLLGKYAKNRCKPDRNFILKMIFSAVCFVAVMMLLREVMFANILITVIYVFVIFFVIYRLKEK